MEVIQSLPIHVNLVNKNIVIVGGGTIAERKIKTLLHTGANIRIVSPFITDYLYSLCNKKNAQWLKKEVEKKDIENAFLIIIATDNTLVNEEIMTWKMPFQLISDTTNLEHSDFYIPASIQRGDLSITISTNGSSPSLVQNIKRKLEQEYDENFIDYVQFLKNARKEIFIHIIDDYTRKKLLKKIAEYDFYSNPQRDELLNREINFYKNNKV